MGSLQERFRRDSVVLALGYRRAFDDNDVKRRIGGVEAPPSSVSRFDVRLRGTWGEDDETTQPVLCGTR